MRRAWLIACAVAGVLLLGLSLAMLASAQSGGTVRTATVDGIPITMYSTGEAAPTVVVAHGFAGSAQIMDPLARGLMRSGFTVVTFDFAGHGANPAALPLAAGQPSTPMDALQRDLGAVIAWAGTQPEVDPAAVTLLGHSMGAGAAQKYAVTHPEVSGTVLLSLPTGGALPVGDPAVPRNLLLLYGSLEDSRFATAALTGLQAGYPDGVVGVRYGDMAAGTAREARAIDGVEHIGILFAPATLDASRAWLGEATGLSPADSTLPPVLLWAVLSLVAGGLLMAPLAAVTLGRRRADAPAVPGRWALGIVYVAAFAASVGAAALLPTADVLPLAVGSFLGLWFVIAALVAGGAWALRWRRATGWPTVTSRGVLGAVLATALATAVLVVPGRLSWAPFAVVGARAWLLPLLIIVLAAYFAADELLVRRAPLGRRIGVTLGSRAILVVMLMLSVSLFGAPGFLALLLPLMVLLLAVLGAYAVVVSRFADSFLAAVLVQAVPLALLVATTFPIVTQA